MTKIRVINIIGVLCFLAPVAYGVFRLIEMPRVAIGLDAPSSPSQLSPALTFSEVRGDFGVHVSEANAFNFTENLPLSTRICFTEGCIEVGVLKAQLKARAWTPNADGSCRVTDRPQ